MLSFNSDHFSRPVWRRRPLLGVAISAAWCMLTGAQLAQAQSAYTQRPILMVVPQAAGGTNDIVGRLVSQKLGEKMYADMQAKQAAEGAQAGDAGAQGASAQADDNVVDAEVKEVKKP